jgi:serine/threonine protein kinase
MFDAGSLGALTPTYASPEMLEGEPPDPRDDIYGLGVVSYILLSSTHPYERHPANLARALELKPKPIAALTKGQNTALAHALEFEREGRTPDIDTFLAELEGEGSVEKRLRFQSRLLVVLSVGFAVMCALVIYLLLR